MTPVISYLLGAFVIAVGFGANAYVQWKLGVHKARTEATSNWKEAYESTNTRLKQVEDELAVIKAQYTAIKFENAGLTKEVNILKQVKPSEMFEETVKLVLSEMQQSREEFMQHAANDQEAFTNMWERIDRTNDIAIQNHNMLKKLCKEG